MGVPTDDVYREYLLTNDQLIPALEPIFTAFAAAGGDPAVLRPVLGVDRAYLERAFSAMQRAVRDDRALLRRRSRASTAPAQRLRALYLTTG